MRRCPRAQAFLELDAGPLDRAQPAEPSPISRVQQGCTVRVQAVQDMLNPNTVKFL